MRIKSLSVGPIEVNCHIAWDDEAKEGIVIDPGGDADIILREIKAAGIKITAVINTHGHSDHIGANTEISEATGAPLYIHAADAPMLTDAKLNLSAFMGMKIISKTADKYLDEGDTVKFGNISLKVIHTPGHSEGGICLYGEGALFSGDTLFWESIGRTDFPGGSLRTLLTNIKEKLLTLPEDTKVFTGHGPATTIGDEKKFNPFLTGRY